MSITGRSATSLDQQEPNTTTESFYSTFHFFLYPLCFKFASFFLFPSNVLLSWGQQCHTRAVSSLLKMCVVTERRGWDQPARFVLSRIIHIMTNVLIQITHPRLTPCTVTQDDLHLASHFLPLLPHFHFISVFIKCKHRNQPWIYDLISPLRL